MLRLRSEPALQSHRLPRPEVICTTNCLVSAAGAPGTVPHLTAWPEHATCASATSRNICPAKASHSSCCVVSGGHCARWSGADGPKPRCHGRTSDQDATVHQKRRFRLHCLIRVASRATMGGLRRRGVLHLPRGICLGRHCDRRHCADLPPAALPRAEIPAAGH